MMRSIIGISHYRPSSIESVFFEDETDIVIGVLHIIMSFLVIIVSLITFMILMLIFIERICNQIIDTYNIGLVSAISRYGTYLK